MADTTITDQQGGLAQAVAPAESTTVPSAPLAAVPAAKPEPSEYEKAQAVYQQQRIQLVEQQKRLIDSLESRVGGPAEMMLAFAGGIGSSPFFGENLSGGIRSMGAQEAQSRQARFDIAKMKLELQMQELGMRKEDIELAKNQDLRKAIGQMISGQQPGGVSGIVSGGAQAKTGLVPQSVAPILSVMAQMNPESALKYIADLAKDDAKRPDAIKALEAYIEMLSPDQREAAKAYAARANIFGKIEDKVSAEKTILDMVADERISPEEGKARIASLRGQGTPSAAPSAPSTPANLPSANLQGNPQDIFAQIAQHPDPAIREEMKQAYIRQLSGQQPTQQAGQEKPFTAKTTTQIASERASAESKAKADVETEAINQRENNKIVSNIPNVIKEADKNISIAKRLEDYVTKNPNAIGLMRQEFVGKTIANFLNEGFHLGQWRARLPIEEVVEKNLPKEQQLVIQNVRSMLMEMALDQAAKLKGSVSNYEDQMVQAVKGNEKNSPEFLAYTARKIRLQSEYDKMISSMYYEERQRNPKLLYTDFVMSDSAKRLQKQFEFAVESAAQKALGAMKK
jgi:hypothetical protein